MAEALVTNLRTPVGKPHPIEEILLVPSGGGVFDVDVDGRNVFSKKAVGRHATIEEVLDSVQKMAS